MVKANGKMVHPVIILIFKWVLLAGCASLGLNHNYSLYFSDLAVMDSASKSKCILARDGLSFHYILPDSRLCVIRPPHMTVYKTACSLMGKRLDLWHRDRTLCTQASHHANTGKKCSFPIKIFCRAWKDNLLAYNGSTLCCQIIQLCNTKG